MIGEVVGNFQTSSTIKVPLQLETVHQGQLCSMGGIKKMSILAIISFGHHKIKLATKGYLEMNLCNEGVDQFNFT